MIYKKVINGHSRYREYLQENTFKEGRQVKDWI